MYAKTKILNSPFAENILKSRISFTPKFRGEVSDSALFMGRFAAYSRQYGDETETCGDSWHGSAKLAVKTGFLAEISESHINLSEHSVLKEAICD